ncbi:MAG TPA: cytochrome b/b6 domain-containing protein [Acetobacteraceae bacterium]|nr:cytochrome b/b6 domain-containing protein [Acetobacteraceae bacterium]
MSEVQRATIPGTDAAHPDGQYTVVAKWFHWITVGLMAIALPMGVVIKHIKDSDKMAFYAIHESVGLTIFLVAVARLAWRLTHPPPPHPAHLPAPLAFVAETVHRLLYAALILQPVLGFLATNAFGFPMQGQTAYLGLIDLPKFMEANTAIAEPLMTAHRVLGYTIMLLLAAHVGGALFHHVVRRDGTLMRMI